MNNHLSALDIQKKSVTIKSSTFGWNSFSVIGDFRTFEQNRWCFSTCKESHKHWTSSIYDIQWSTDEKVSTAIRQNSFTDSIMWWICTLEKKQRDEITFSFLLIPKRFFQQWMKFMFHESAQARQNFRRKVQNCSRPDITFFLLSHNVSTVEWMPSNRKVQIFRSHAGYYVVIETSCKCINLARNYMKVENFV